MVQLTSGKASKQLPSLVYRFIVRMLTHLQGALGSLALTEEAIQERAPWQVLAVEHSVPATSIPYEIMSWYITQTVLSCSSL